MGRKYIGIYFLVFMLSCNCQQPVSKKDLKVTASNESVQIGTFLREKNFEIIKNANAVIDYDIKKTLIEGTTDEYSNKVFLKDTLKKTAADELLALIKDDASYNWNGGEESKTFDPNRQFLIRSTSGSVVLLFDEEENKLGFINLEGQKVVRLSPGFSKYLKSL